jgi:hypothetical protein
MRMVAQRKPPTPRTQAAPGVRLPVQLLRGTLFGLLLVVPFWILVVVFTWEML